MILCTVGDVDLRAVCLRGENIKDENPLTSFNMSWEVLNFCV